MSNTDTVMDHGESAPTGVVIDAAQRFEHVDASGENQRRFYTAVYGAGTFVVAATSETEAAEIAADQRTDTVNENALPLAMPLTAKEEGYLHKRYPGGTPEITTVSNPLNAPPREKVARRVEPTPGPNQMRLFSWIIHGRTGQIKYTTSLTS